MTLSNTTMMKSVMIAMVLSSASAFIAPRPKVLSSSARSSSEFEGSPEPAAPEEASTEMYSAPAPPAPVKKQRIAAKWLPVGGTMAPAVLDGTLAGDVGFDPLGFSKSEKTLYWMREAETKHGRLAMLAAIGWPLSELWHKELANAFGLESILSAGDRAPSLLNGGLSNVWATGMLMMSIIIAGYLEGKAMNSGEVFWGAEKPEGYVPGAYSFDPLNLYGIRGDRKTMETAEIKNGRLAMIAITAYVFQEAVSGLPVVQQTPYLF